jgi:hypothetical protein
MDSQCSYCQGYTKADERGNCSGCGAPKQPASNIVDLDLRWHGAYLVPWGLGCSTDSAEVLGYGIELDEGGT